MSEAKLKTEVQFLKGVGPRGAAMLAKANLFVVEDVLNYMPRRYEDRSHLPPISQIEPGQFATVRGKIFHVEDRQTNRGLTITKAFLRDRSGQISLTWFNQGWIRRMLEKVDGEIIAYGLAKQTSTGLEMGSPEWEAVLEDDDPDDFARITPVYRLTEGLPQKLVRKAAHSAVEYFLGYVEDPLPPDLRRQQGLHDLRWSLHQIHRPDSEVDRLAARQRLVFDEFFLLQLSLALRRAETHQELGISFPISALLRGDAPPQPSPESTAEPSTKAAVVRPREHPTHLFEEAQREQLSREPLEAQMSHIFPFTLTGAQQRVIREIWADMELPHPMNRLVQGDVGSGKTAVAASCMLAAVRSGYQAALMAPTEILAEQHCRSLQRLFAPLGIEVDLLVGKLTATQKRKITQRTKDGLTQIAVGTHALISEGVEFLRLGFVVIDEQHRFGVLQRMALREKALGNPDVLVMTATPIPRTLTMTQYGDLDLSIIDELPPGRKPIKTHWKLPHERESVNRAVRKLIDEGRQAYYVCPMVSENEKMLAQAAEELHRQLSEETFPDLRVGLLHGQMKSKEKDDVMEQFRAHELDILVSTTVIEVGVDVPNASVMVIEDANRFGLSQLHQLRGRVGRGIHQSFCVLVADAKSEDAQARMDIMVQTNDGFRIAEEDLRLRGPGDLAGTRQSGNLDFRIADLVQDGRLLEVARQVAMKVIEEDPMLSDPKWAVIRRKVQERRSEVAVVTVS